MLTVKHAAFRRVLERGRQLYGEVEVHTDHPLGSRLLAYFRKEDNGKLQLVFVMRENPESGAGGGEDGFAVATEDVTERMFSGPNHSAGEDRHVFGRQIASVDEVREALERHLG